MTEDAPGRAREPGDDLESQAGQPRSMQNSGRPPTDDLTVPYESAMECVPLDGEARIPPRDRPEGQGRDRLPGCQRPGHPLAGERLDIAGRVAEQEEPFRGDRAGLPRESRRPFPSGGFQFVDRWDSGLGEDRERGSPRRTVAPDSLGLEGRGDIQAAIRQADKSDVSVASHGHEDRPFLETRWRHRNPAAGSDPGSLGDPDAMRRISRQARAAESGGREDDAGPDLSGLAARASWTRRIPSTTAPTRARASGKKWAPVPMAAATSSASSRSRDIAAPIGRSISAAARERSSNPRLERDAARFRDHRPQTGGLQDRQGPAVEASSADLPAGKAPFLDEQCARALDGQPACARPARRRDPRRSRLRPRGRPTGRPTNWRTRFQASTTPGEQESERPVTSQPRADQARPPGQPLRFGQAEGRVHRGRPVVVHDRRAAQHPAARPGQLIAEPASEQVVDQDQVSGGVRHLLQQHGGLIVPEMMKVQRTHHGVILIGDRLLQDAEREESHGDARIPGAPRGELDGHGADVAAIDPEVEVRLGRAARQDDRHIPAARGQVEDASRASAIRRGQPRQCRP